MSYRINTLLRTALSPKSKLNYVLIAFWREKVGESVFLKLFLEILAYKQPPKKLTTKVPWVGSKNVLKLIFY